MQADKHLQNHCPLWGYDGPCTFLWGGDDYMYMNVKF